MTGRLPLSLLFEDRTPEERAEVAAGTARIVEDSDRREGRKARRAPQRPLRRDERPSSSPSR